MGMAAFARDCSSVEKVSPSPSTPAFSGFRDKSRTAVFTVSKILEKLALEMWRHGRVIPQGPTADIIRSV